MGMVTPCMSPLVSKGVVMMTSPLIVDTVTDLGVPSLSSISLSWSTFPANPGMAAPGPLAVTFVGRRRSSAVNPMLRLPGSVVPVRNVVLGCQVAEVAPSGAVLVTTLP